MNPDDIQTIEDLLAFLGEEKVSRLFQDYLIEVIGKRNQETSADFEY